MSLLFCVTMGLKFKKKKTEKDSYSILKVLEDLCRSQEEGQSNCMTSGPEHVLDFRIKQEKVKKLLMFSSLGNQTVK